MSGLTKQQQAQAISTIFGTEAMSGMMALVEQGPEKLQSLTKELEGSNGAARKMAETRLDSLQGQMIILKSAVEGMNIELGERLAPYAKKFVKWLTGKIPDITNKIVQVADAISKSIPKIKQLLSSLIPIIAGVTAAFTTLKIAAAIGSTIGVLGPILSNISFAFAAVAGGAATFGEAMLFLMGPVGWIALAIGALTTVGVLLYKNWNTIKEKAGALKDKFVELKNNAIDKIKEALESAKQKFIDFKDNAVETVKEKLETFKQTLKDNEEEIKTVASILGAIFGPALIKTGIQAAIAGTKIAIELTGKLIDLGLQAIITSGKLIGDLLIAFVRTGYQAVIAGARIIGNFVFSLVRVGGRSCNSWRKNCRQFNWKFS